MCVDSIIFFFFLLDLEFWICIMHCCLFSAVFFALLSFLKAIFIFVIKVGACLAQHCCNKLASFVYEYLWKHAACNAKTLRNHKLCEALAHIEQQEMKRSKMAPGKPKVLSIYKARNNNELHQQTTTTEQKTPNIG